MVAARSSLVAIAPRSIDAGMETLDSAAVIGHVAVALLGASLLALAPSLAPRGGTGFQYLPEYASVVGALLVLWAASLRMPALLAALAFILSGAAFASALAGPGHADVQRSSMGLLCAAAILMGSAVRGPWVAPLFLFAPLAIEQVATGTWNLGREAFSAQWAVAIGCDCPTAGFPAALAVPPTEPARPSALGPLLASVCVALAGAVVFTILPASLESWQGAALWVMGIAAAAAWLLLAYQLGRWWLVLDGFLAAAAALGGAAYSGHALVDAVPLGAGVGLVIAMSLIPAALAAIGVLLRMAFRKHRHRIEKVIQATVEAGDDTGSGEAGSAIAKPR